ncbi:EAL domain-containing protein [Caldimonas thermodepolymerans]|jgi:EAL domain-containing protein (putative c-di-GMP-specific phosphodiesterase class I)|uniref:EAL domain-containing protein (Putative c-di-GMP-specific phosphodiesterase class I) n=1 Tax=Caldimonas thermodepolymerans TaxID=215580 RepID=A0AA46DFJ1_9BURK|nr:EAL domain-containing protein [Caldimonas thermodepolymerans]TCP08641.1 EAL domain-containing protein (putative c-di-GMP-specific phosphodiesterase class I) [Caldimonas thermodepolymerans]UZG43302.1 EAL domain-containing protein [Caldimonas thermodepolymerans]UZG46969.1 EAL domain-containing protein [Caldimonas thermodepolymerans]
MHFTEAATALPELDLEGESRFAAHGEYRLTTHFQPIYSLSHRRAVGHEALLRARNARGDPVAPHEVLGQAQDFDELERVDRLCRWLHASNYVAQQQRQDHWLFLNIHPKVFADGSERGTRLFLQQLAERLGLAPSQLVLEVTEDVTHQNENFEAAVRVARDVGYLLALDDFGAGHSNFDRVWRIRPEIVKLDRSVVQRAASEPRIARVVAQMVSLLHECGALVLTEGIETMDEAYLALDSDVDFVQGHLFGRPMPQLHDTQGYPAVIDAVWRRFDEQHESRERRYQERIAPYVHALGYAATLLKAGRSMEQACARFLALEHAELCYLLDEQGLQVGSNLTSRRFKDDQTRRFAPLADGSHARWARRPYFRRALEFFGQVQVTRPYLTVHGARLCVTVSVAFRTQDRTLVLGGDIAWERE